MSTLRFLLLLAITSAGVISVIGCSRDSTAPPAPSASEQAADEPSPSDVPEAFAALAEADRATALAQKVCPVSGQELGSMGAPIKVTVEGRDVWLCCAGCRDMILGDPAKYLAKLDTNSRDAE